MLFLILYSLNLFMKVSVTNEKTKNLCGQTFENLFVTLQTVYLGFWVLLYWQLLLLFPTPSLECLWIIAVNEFVTSLLMCGTVFCFSFLLLSDGLCWLSFTLYQLLVRSFNNLTSMLENFIFQDQNWSANVLGDRKASDVNFFNQPSCQAQWYHFSIGAWNKYIDQ